MKQKTKIIVGATLLALAAAANAQDSGFYVGGSIGQASYQDAPIGEAVPISIFSSIAEGLGAPDGNAVVDQFLAQPPQGFSMSGESDKTDTSYKGYIGYKFNRYFAIEGGYASLGKTSAKNRVIYDADGDGGSGAGDGSYFQMDSTLENKNTAWFVEAVGILPINAQFSIFAKAGTAYVKSEANGGYNYVCTGSDCVVMGDFTFQAGGNVTGVENDNAGSLRLSDDASNWVPKIGVGAEYNLTENFAVRAEYERYFSVGEDKLAFESDVDMWSLGVKVSF